jgi:hypothetical protein
MVKQSAHRQAERPEFFVWATIRYKNNCLVNTVNRAAYLEQLITQLCGYFLILNHGVPLTSLQFFFAQSEILMRVGAEKAGKPVRVKRVFVILCSFSLAGS